MSRSCTPRTTHTRLWRTADDGSPEGCNRDRVIGEQLTPREQSAAVLLAYGYTNQDIARELNVSIRTVESERAHLMRKLGFDRRAELVRWALENGFLR